MKATLIFIFFLTGMSAQADVIEFRIAKGTGSQSWNTSETAIQGAVGDTLRIVNEDDVDHQLHTYGSPCAHGPLIEPGKSWDCLAERPYHAHLDGPLYDHIAGESAEVWIEVTE